MELYAILTLVCAVVSFLVTLLLGRLVIPMPGSLSAKSARGGTTIRPVRPPWAALCLL